MVVLAALVLAGCAGQSEDFGRAASLEPVPSSALGLLQGNGSIEIDAGDTFLAFGFSGVGPSLGAALDADGYLGITLYSLDDGALKRSVGNYGSAKAGSFYTVGGLSDGILIVAAHVDRSARLSVALDEGTVISWARVGQAAVSGYHQSAFIEPTTPSKIVEVGVSVLRELAEGDAWLGGGVLKVSSDHVIASRGISDTLVFVSSLAGGGVANWAHDSESSGAVPLVGIVYGVNAFASHAVAGASQAALSVEGVRASPTIAYVHITLDWDPADEGLRFAPRSGGTAAMPTPDGRIIIPT